MVARAILLTLILVGVVAVGLAYAFRPMIRRCTDYLRALDAHDEEKMREAKEAERLREHAERELDGLLAEPPEEQQQRESAS